MEERHTVAGHVAVRVAVGSVVPVRVVVASGRIASAHDATADVRTVTTGIRSRVVIVGEANCKMISFSDSNFGPSDGCHHNHWILIHWIESCRQSKVAPSNLKVQTYFAR